MNKDRIEEIKNNIELSSVEKLWLISKEQGINITLEDAAKILNKKVWK